MRSILTLFCGVPLLAFGQSLVSTSPQLRTVLLEDFTGIHCGYCPDGHAIADALHNEHQNELVVVGVHAGPFAVPNPGEPDFRTTWGTEIDAHFTIGGYPAGVINRHLFGGADDLGRGAWEGAVNEVLTFTSPVNVGVESSFDAGTRDLTVTVELLYTANSPGGSDHISVLLKESHIFGWQTDYANGNHTNYDHTNVLRAYITDTWGDEVTTTTAGTSVIRAYTFNVPAAWDITNCEVVAFASEYQSEVYQAREVKAEGGTTLLVGELTNSGASHAAGQNAVTTPFTFNSSNLLGADEDYLVTLTSDDQPLDWSSSFVINGTTYTSSATINIPMAGDEDITVNIVPGPTPAISNYLLKVASLSNPDAPVLEQDLHVISGVTDLIVSNPIAEPWEPIYTNALVAASNNNRASTSRNTMIDFGLANALSGVEHIYCNVSWTFPSLTDQTVAVLQAHMDAGGNLMIAGQDIGWDQSGVAGSYGTPATQAFYTNYMYADYVADGSTANSQVDFVDADFIFGGLRTPAITDVFAGNNYPEEITPLAPASSILTYNVPTKIGGLRVETSDYKLVYFGTGPEQMTDANIGLQMVKLSHDWFHGVVSVNELDAAFASLLAWPVPADRLLTVDVTGIRSAATIALHDPAGRTVISQQVQPGSTTTLVDVTGLSAGGYTLRMVSNGQAITRPVQVMH